MAKFWNKVLEVILSRGQRERHEKFLFDKQCGGPLSSPISPSSGSPLDRQTSPDFRSTLKPMLPTPKTTPRTSLVFQVTAANSPTYSSPSVSPVTPITSPISSRNGSPTYTAPLNKAMGGGAPRALLPRHPREDRACLTLEPLLEANILDPEKISYNKEYSSKSTPPKADKPQRERKVLLYEVPPLGQTEGIGRYRRSVNATDEFIDSALKRKDSFTDLLPFTIGEKPRRTGSGEWGVNPGNMDTTSPPPPRKAFSRGNSPVRLAIYGVDADQVGEEELEEINGKLIFGRRKSRTKALSTSAEDQGSSKKDEEEKSLITTSDPGVTTTGVSEKDNLGKKRQPAGPAGAKDDEPSKGRRKAAERTRGAGGKARGDNLARIRQATASEELEVAIESEFEDVEDVESFSGRSGEKLAKATVGGGKKKKVVKAPEPVQRGRRTTRAQGPTAAKAGGARRAAKK